MDLTPIVNKEDNKQTDHYKLVSNGERMNREVTENNLVMWEWGAGGDVP